MKPGLRDKVAIITGAGAGIGLVIAHGLAAEGVHLVMASSVMAAREPDRLADAATQISERHHVRAVGVAGDVGTGEGAASIAAAAEKEFGGAGREVAALLGSACDGSGQAGARPGALDAPARRRHPAQCEWTCNGLLYQR